MHARSRYEQDPDTDYESAHEEFDHEELLRAVAALRDDGRSTDSEVQDLRGRRRVDDDDDLDDGYDEPPDEAIAEARRVRNEIADLMRTYEAAMGLRRAAPSARRPRRERRAAPASRPRPERRDERTRKALILMMLAELL